MSEFVPHSSMDLSPAPVGVVYCSICGLPTDYCKYGPLWDQHPSDIASNEEPKSAKVVAPKLDSSSKSEGSTSTKNPSGTITVKIAPRIGRRYLSTVVGLHSFDVDLGKACRIFAKKFACGVGKKDESDEIEIQGDVEEQIVETITSNFKAIKAKQIVIKRK